MGGQVGGRGGGENAKKGPYLLINCLETSHRSMSNSKRLLLILLMVNVQGHCPDSWQMCFDDNEV